MSTSTMALQPASPGEIQPAEDWRPLYAQAVQRFIAEKRTTGTRANYRRVLDAYQEHCELLDNSPFGGDAVQAYNGYLRAQLEIGGIAADTVRFRLTVLKAFVLWCHDYHLTPITAGELRRWLHLPPPRLLSGRDVLTDDEARRLIELASCERDRLLIRVMLGGGLRVSEALALRRQDLWSRAERYYVHIAHGKGDKARDVEIAASLHDDLSAWAISRHLHTDGRLFDLDRGNAWRMVAHTAERAGLVKAITPHSLRHTHAHHLRLAGMPLEVVSRRLGHASLDVTMRYTRPAELELALPLPAMPWDGPRKQQRKGRTSAAKHYLLSRQPAGARLCRPRA